MTQSPETAPPTVMPRKWQRFQSQLEGRDFQLPLSGANVTIDDLIRGTEQRIAADQSDAIDTDILEPYAPGQQVPGWIGTPDPTKFARGTTYLKTEELVEEVDKGNIILVDDWRQAIKELEPWQREIFQNLMTMDYLQNRVFFEMGPSEQHPNGGKVSVLDLYRYVKHNPELKALVERQRSIAVAGGEGQEGDPHQITQDLLPFRGSPDNDQLMGLTQEQMRHLPWTCVGTGKVWGRRPTRWLKGMDGQLDFVYGVFVHEDAAEKVLGPRWAGRPDREVMNDSEYWQDILKAGPTMGMTFMIAAARDVPVDKAASRWTELIAKRMAARGESQDQATHALTSLGALMDLNRIVTETRLLHFKGSHIREGSTLMVTTLPGGRVTVQAMTGDPVRNRSYYVLGHMDGYESLSSSLTSLALGGGAGKPQEAPIDEEIVEEAAARLLLTVNGYKGGDESMSGPAISIDGTYMPAVSLIGKPKVSMFRLPAVGKKPALQQGLNASQQQPPMVLHGVQEEAVDATLQAIVCAAASAADEASAALPPGSAEDVILETRRRAAQQALAESFAKVGLDARFDSGLEAQKGSGLLKAAVPLSEASLAEVRA